MKRIAALALCAMLLGACATHPARSGARPRGDLRLDTESVARVRHANKEALGGEVLLLTP